MARFVVGRSQECPAGYTVVADPTSSTGYVCDDGRLVLSTSDISVQAASPARRFIAKRTIEERVRRAREQSEGEAPPPPPAGLPPWAPWAIGGATAIGVGALLWAALR